MLDLLYWIMILIACLLWLIVTLASVIPISYMIVTWLIGVYKYYAGKEEEDV